MGQVWEIRPNGTGKFTDTGPFYSPGDETQFEWRQSQAFVFEMRVTGYPSDRESAEEGIEEVEDEWVSIRYDFISVQTDVGVVIGLITLSEAGDQITSFYGSMAPLSYAGTVE